MSAMGIVGSVLNGVRSSISAVVEYLPRGVIFSGMLLAGSAALGMISPNLDLLDIGEIYKNSGAAGITGRILASLALGSVLTVGFHALHGAGAAQSETLAATPLGTGTQPRMQGPERQRAVDYGTDFPSQHLPQNLPMNKPVGRNPVQPGITR